MKTKSKSYSKSYPRTASVFFEKDNLNKSFHKTLKDIKDITHSLKSGKLSFSYGGRPIRANPSDIVRVISQKPYNDPLQLCYRNIILNYALSLEQLSVYSGFTFLDILFSKDQKLSAKTRVTFEEVESIAKRHLGPGICFEIIRETIRNAGLFCETYISINTDKTEEKFKVKFEEMLEQPGKFSSAFLPKVEKMSNSSLIFVEGTIEKVSEIHRLLESSAESDREVVIIAHNFYSDVSHTLSENFKTGKLKVVPFEVSGEITSEFFDQMGIYTVNTDNGRTLSLTSIDDLQSDYNVSFKRGNIRIEGLEGIGRTVHISVPHHFSKQLGIIEDRINSGLIFCQELSKYGIILDEKGTGIYGVHQYRKAVEALKNFNLSSDNIGCVVTHDV